jgi:choline-sulfatase
VTAACPVPPSPRSIGSWATTLARSRAWSRMGLGLLGATLLAANPEPAPVPSPPPSLVVISLDTARADHFGCYGYTLKTTPEIDRLAREGVQFERAYTQAVNTVPSHASLFTGLYPSGHGSRLNAVPLNPEFDTLAEILSRAGYKTAAFVSGSTLIASQSGLDQGFELYDDQFTGQDRRAGETVDRALAWTKKLPPDRPFMLFVHLFDPHGPYEPPEGFAAKFRTGAYPAIEDPNRIPEYLRIPLPGGGFSRDPLDYISRYDGEIRYADSQIGRLLAGLGAKPMVVFVADHGETLVDRDYYFSHGARLTEEAIRVPLILRFPDPALNGKKIPGAAQLIDVLPTVLATLHQSVPRKLPGTNLLPYIRTGKIPAGRSIISEARGGRIKIGERELDLIARDVVVSSRTDRYKLIRYPVSPPVFELFDLEADPQEKRNLAATETGLVSHLFGAIDLYLVSGRPPQMPEPDEETKRKLRSLGYVD